MITSLASSILAEPTGDEKISPKSLAYASENARDQLYDLVVRACIETGVNNATIAKRLGKDPSQISRLLGASGNWTIDTFAQLLFAANGSLLEAHCYHPLRQAVSNRRHPNCFGEDGDDIQITIISPNEKSHQTTRKLASPVEFQWQQ